MQINIYDNVWVKLTPAGKEKSTKQIEHQENGWTHYQIWALISDFAPHLEKDGIHMFVNNEIHFSQPK